MTHYKGFDLDSRFNIFKDGKQIFTAPHQFCQTLDEAIQTIDNSLSAAARFSSMIDKQAALKRMTTGPCELENNSQAISDFTDKVNNYFEMQMFENERD